jgi:hypothetical protein
VNALRLLIFLFCWCAGSLSAFGHAAATFDCDASGNTLSGSAPAPGAVDGAPPTRGLAKVEDRTAVETGTDHVAETGLNPLKNGDMTPFNQPALEPEKVILCQYSGPFYEMLNGGLVPLTSSAADRSVLSLLQQAGSPQNTSLIVPEAGQPFPFNKSSP